jgi:hypothetical protein
MKAQRPIVSAQNLLFIRELLADLEKQLDLMIAGPEGGPSSDMQRYEG